MLKQLGAKFSACFASPQSTNSMAKGHKYKLFQKELVSLRLGPSIT